MLEAPSEPAFGLTVPLHLQQIADEVVDIFLPVRFYWVRRARWLKLHPEQENTKEEGE